MTLPHIHKVHTYWSMGRPVGAMVRGVEGQNGSVLVVVIEENRRCCFISCYGQSSKDPYFIYYLSSYHSNLPHPRDREIAPARKYSTTESTYYTHEKRPCPSLLQSSVTRSVSIKAGRASGSNDDALPEMRLVVSGSISPAL